MFEDLFNKNKATPSTTNTTQPTKTGNMFDGVFSNTAKTPATPVKNENPSLLTKVERFLLPKQLEYQLGITEKPKEEQQKTVENYATKLQTPVFDNQIQIPQYVNPSTLDQSKQPKLSQGYFEMPKDTPEEINKRLEEGYLTIPRQLKFEKILAEENKKAKEINPYYKEPEGFWGQFVEGVKFGIKTMSSTPGYLAETIGVDIGNKKLIDWGQEFGDRQVAKLITQNPELFRPEKFGTTRAWVGRVIGEQLPIWATMLTTSIIGGLVGGPVGAGIGGYGSVYALEQTNAYKQMLDDGIAPDKAVYGSKIYGAISSAIENMFGYSPAKIGQEVIKDEFKKFALSEIPKIGKEILKKSLEEGGEEAVQQLTQNLISKFYNKEQPVWDGVAQSFIEATIGSLPAGGSEIIPYAKGIGKTNTKKEIIQQPIEKTNLEVPKPETVKEEVNPDTAYGKYLKKTMPPAEYAAKIIERKLGGQEALRQSPKGATLLKEQLTKEEKISQQQAKDQQLNDIVDYVLGRKEMPKPSVEAKKQASDGTFVAKGISMPTKTDKQKQDRLNYLNNEINKEIENFRKEADLMASNERAGVRQYKGETQTETKIYNSFKKGRAGADMKKRSEDMKNYSHELLYENVSRYRDLINERDQLKEKLSDSPSLDEIDVEAMFQDVSQEVEKLNEATTQLGEIEAVKSPSVQTQKEVRTNKGEQKEVEPDTNNDKPWTGEYTAGRLSLHNDIVKKLLSNKEVNADIVKDYIPGYKPSLSDEYQKESSDIAKKLGDAKQKLLKDKTDKRLAYNVGLPGAGKSTVLKDKNEKYDFYFDSVGRNIDGLRNKINKAKKRGFKVDLNLVYITSEESINRQEYRKVNDQRWVSREYINSSKGAPERTFFELKDSVDNWSIIDNENFRNTREVAFKSGERLTINNQKLYDKIKNYGKQKPTTEEGQPENTRPREGARPSGEQLLGGLGRVSESTTITPKETQPPTVEEGGFSLKEKAKQLAIDLIQGYVKRGDSFESLKGSYLGVAGEDGRVNIGGYVNGEKIKPDQIAVTRIGKEELKKPIIFSLKTLFDEIKSGLKAKTPEYIEYEGKKIPIIGTIDSATGKVTYEDNLIKDGYSPEEAKEMKDMADKNEFGPVIPKVYNNMDTALTDMTKDGQISAFIQPRNQLEYVVYKLYHKEQIPEELNWLGVNLAKEGVLMRVEDGEGVKIDTAGLYWNPDNEPTIADYILDDEMMSGEGLNDFYHINEFTPETDWRTLQNGFGIGAVEGLGFQKGDIVSSSEIEGKTIKTKKGKEKTLPGYGVVIDAFDNERVLVYTDKGFESLSYFNLKSADIEKATKEEKAIIGELSAKSPLKTNIKLPSKELPGSLFDNYLDNKDTKFRIFDPNINIIQNFYNPTRPLTTKFLELPDVKNREFGSYEFLMNLSNSVSVGLKAEEKEIVQNILNDQYKDSKRIMMDEFRKSVIAQALPLGIIKTDTYSSYGSSNVRLDDLNTTTYLLNSPYAHGYTGHFSSDYSLNFEKDSELEIKEIPVSPQNPTPKYAVIKKGVVLDARNIEENVFTVANTRQEAQIWIINHIKSGSSGKTIEVMDKGLFAHFRTFDEKIKNNVERELNKSIGKNTESVSYIAEIQSDPFQQNEYNKREKDIKNLKIDIENWEEEIASQERALKEKTPYADKATIKQRLLNYKERLKTDQERLREIESFAGAKSLSEKLFSGYRDIWHERAVREIISLKASEGFESLRFPTPRTVAVIEGFISTDEENTRPYDIVSGDEDGLNFGDTIDYGGKEMTVVDVNGDYITVAESEKVRNFDYQDAMDEELNFRWDDILYSFKEVQEDFGEIKNSEDAQNVIDKIDIYNRYIDFKNKSKDIKKEKEYSKNKTDKLKVEIDQTKSNGGGNSEYFKKQIRELQAMITQEEVDLNKKIDLIKERKNPTKEELSTLSEKTLDQVKKYVYRYSFEFRVENILEKMSNENPDKELNIDDYEEDTKYSLAEVYDPDFEGMYGRGNVFYQDKGYNNSQVWIVESGIKEQFQQPNMYKEAPTIEDFDINKFTGNQRTVLNFYDKKVNRYLGKIRKDLRTITDDNGFEWLETKITPNDNNAPTAYRIKENLAGGSLYITNAQEAQIIALNRKIFGDDSVQFVPKIIGNKNALGSYRKGMINILQGQANSLDSYYHEVVHKYLDVFTTRDEHISILKEVMNKHLLFDPAEAEEIVSENFINYAQKRTGFFGKLRILFERIINRIKKFFNSENQINSLYNDILSGQAMIKTELKPSQQAYFREVNEPISNQPTDDEIEAFNYIQNGDPIPANLLPAVEGLKAKGLLNKDYIPPVKAIKTPKGKKERPAVRPMQPGEKITERGIILRRLQKEVPNQYIVSYKVGENRVIRTFKTVEDARARYDAMVNVRKFGAYKKGELPPELQPSDIQKQVIHRIVNNKKITPNQYKRLAVAYTGVDSTLKMTPEQADHFIDMLKQIKPKFGGKVVVPMKTDLVLQEVAERKFTDTKLGWLLDILRTPEHVFKKIGIAPETQPIFEGEKLRRDFVNHTFGKIAEWQKELGVRHPTIFTRKKFEAESRKLFIAMNTGKTEGLTEKEQLVIAMAKQLANEIADNVDEARNMVGLDPINRRTNYITNLLTDEGHFLIENTKQAPNELYAILDERLPSKVFDRLLLERKGGLPIKEDFWKALKAMTQMHAKYIYLNPPVHRLAQFMRFYGDKIPYLSRKYINFEVKRFLGRPVLIETFLRSVDNQLTKLLAGVPGMSKKYNLELANGIEEVINVPRLNLKLTQSIVPAMKSIRYMYDLTWSVSFYALNLTQFWVNTVPKLRGNTLDIYRSAFGAYTQMLVDFLRPSRWEYWRQRGVLTEIDNVIDNEYRVRAGGAVLNIFAKLSEFNNRVASTLATEKNIKLLAEKGKLKTLYPELNSAFGAEAEEYARNLSDITQFRYGLGTKPIAFDNPIMSLFYQYNTFALKQAELVEGIVNNVGFKTLFEDFKTAYENGTTKEFIANLTEGQRGEMIRFLINAFILSLVLGSGWVWDSVFKGMIPSQITGMKDVIEGFWTGDKDLRSKGYKEVLTPPAWTLFEDLSQYGIKSWLLNSKVAKQLNLIYGVIIGEPVEIKSKAGKIIEKVSPEIAVSRLINSTREKTSKSNSDAWDLKTKIDIKYDSTRTKAIDLIKNGKTPEAKNLVRIYNNWAKQRINELKSLQPTDLRLRDAIKKQKAWIVDTNNFDSWKKSAKEL